MSSTVIATFIAFIGEILGTITGLGNATFFVPILSFFTSFDHVLGIVAFLHVFSNITRISFFWKNISKEVFVRFGISNIIFVAVGAVFTKYIDTHIIEIVLGGLLIIFSLYEVIFKQIKLSTTPRFEAVSGAIAGFLGGLVGTSGPFRSFVLINIGLSKEAYIATSVAVDFLGDVLRLFIYIYNGFVTAEIFKLLPFVFIASLIGALLGKQLLHLIPSKWFTKGVIIALFLLGCALLYNNTSILISAINPIK
jgi:uncharacterized protein